MQRILRVLAIGAFATLVTAPVARAEVVTNVIEPFTGSLFVPCANGGAGEIIVGTGGALHVLFALTVNGNIVSGHGQTQPLGVTGVGVNTGDIYHGTGVTANQFTFTVQNLETPFTFTFVNNFRIIGPGTGNNFLVHETSHVTINANGETTVVHDNFRVECK
jgi:hypothetical protein